MPAIRKFAVVFSFMLLLLWTNRAAFAEEKSASVSSEAKLVVQVKKEKLDVQTELPGELLAFRDVPIHAKVEGYISWIGVDRGSMVKAGQAMIKISCPELDEKLREAEAKVSSAQSTWRESQARYQSEVERQGELKAQYEGDQLTANRLFEANKTPGAVAQNEVDQAQKKVEADLARLQAIASNVRAMSALETSQKQNILAAQKVLQAIKEMHVYLTIKAPFDGVITERNVHEGSIVAVESGRTGEPLVRIQDRKKLRLVVAVPESAVSGISKGRVLEFTVPAFMGRKFHGTISRPGYALDHNTRTMPVELDVDNTSELEPGMYAKVDWMQSRSTESLFVPAPSIGSDLKGSFVMRVRQNKCQRIPVKTGVPMRDLMEVEGDLSPGDTVLLRADSRALAELKSGVRLAGAAEIKAAGKRGSSTGD